MQTLIFAWFFRQDWRKEGKEKMTVKTLSAFGLGLGLALLASASAHSNMILSVSQSATALEFTVIPSGGRGEVHQGQQGTGLTWSLAQISARGGISAAINMTTLWFTPNYSVADGFLLDPVTGPIGFEGSSYSEDGGVWTFRYVNPYPILPPQVQDTGGVLGMMGCAMLGLWGARRVLA